jgi:heparan-alpha-glucosaminide N-acetyltransferase
MGLGLIAGERLRRNASPKSTVGWLVAWGVGLLLLGLAFDHFGLCPIVKILWTPSFALVSGGLCLLILALLYSVIDWACLRSWALPAEVVGRNSLAMYIMTWTIAGWVLMNLKTHLGADAFNLMGEEYALFLGNLSVGIVLWLICWWMDRNRVYVRI